MDFDASAVEDKFLEVDGKKYFEYSPIIALVDDQLRRIPGYRWGQAIYNVLTFVGQHGIPSALDDPWNELYQQPNRELAQIEFDKRFVVMDDYIIPRDVVAGTPAYVTA